MTITIVHKPGTCYFPQILCKVCLHKQYIFNGNKDKCSACSNPFPLSANLYASIFEKIHERINFFNNKLNP